MAELYLRHIRVVQPSGPYMICGYYMGGTVALEVAHQLREQGDEVVFWVFSKLITGSIFVKRILSIGLTIGGRKLFSTGATFYFSMHHKSECFLLRNGIRCDNNEHKFGGSHSSRCSSDGKKQMHLQGKRLTQTSGFPQS